MAAAAPPPTTFPVRIGFGVGELMIWSRPWQSKRAWQAYQRTYGEPASSVARRTYRLATGWDP